MTTGASSRTSLPDFTPCIHYLPAVWSWAKTSPIYASKIFIDDKTGIITEHNLIQLLYVKGCIADEYILAGCIKNLSFSTSRWAAAF